MKALRVKVFGRVQGVWYRAWTQERAEALGLRGWVRNRKDGSVEAVLAGEEDAVDKMLALLREGPPLARVAEISSDPWEGDLPSGFEQRPSC